MLNTVLRTSEKFRNWEQGLIYSAIAHPIILSLAILANQKLDITINKISALRQVKILYKTNNFSRYGEFILANPQDSIIFFALPIVSMMGWAWFTAHLLREIDPLIHIKGRRFLVGKEAINSASDSQKDAIKNTGAGVWVGDVLISRQKMLQSFLIMGAQGGGKTVVINSVLKQTIENGHKNIIFDLTKGDFTGWVTNCNIISPTDSRTCHWWLGDDLLDLGDAASFAASMIPGGGNDPFWASVAQNIVISCILKLQIEKGQNWSWTHLSYLIFESEIEQLKEIANEFYPPAKDSILDAESKMTGSIIVTIRSFCSSIYKMSLVAKKINKKHFSLIKYLDSENPAIKNLIIQGDKKDSELSSALARALVNLFTKHISSLQFSESRDRYLNLFLDELPQAGKLQDIASAMEIGRSKGISVILGFQDISQINQIYGKDEAQKWLALTGVKIFPKVQGSVSQKFVGDEVGEREIEWRAKTTSASQNGNGSGASMQRASVAVILPSQLETDFGPRKNGIEALVLGLGGDAIKLNFSFAHYPKIRKSWVGWLKNEDETESVSALQIPTNSKVIAAEIEQKSRIYESQKTDFLSDFDQLMPAEIKNSDEVSSLQIPADEVANEVLKDISEPAVNSILGEVLGIDSHVVEVAESILGVGEAVNSDSFIPANTQHTMPKARKRNNKINVEKE